MKPFTSRLIALATKIDLAEHHEEFPNPPIMNGGKKEPYYPSIHVSDKDAPIDLPVDGHAIVRYKVTGRSMDERDGKQRHGATIKIHSIEHQPVVPAIERMGKPLSEVNACSSGGSFSARKLHRGMIVFGDPRPRNGEGQFSPVTEGVPSPNAMAAAYGSGTIGKSLVNGVAAGAGAAVGIQGTKLAGRTLLKKIRAKI